jgi:hypothetical protein
MQQQRELIRNHHETDKRLRGLGLVFARSFIRLAQKLLLFLLTFLGIQKSKKMLE